MSSSSGDSTTTVESSSTSSSTSSEASTRASPPTPEPPKTVVPEKVEEPPTKKKKTSKKQPLPQPEPTTLSKEEAMRNQRVELAKLREMVYGKVSGDGTFQTQPDKKLKKAKKQNAKELTKDDIEWRKVMEEKEKEVSRCLCPPDRHRCQMAVENVDPPKRKRAKAVPKKRVPTNDPNVEVLVATKRKGKPPKKKVITVYKEDLEDDPVPTQVVIKNKKKGRPREEPDLIEVKEETIVLERPNKKTKPPTKKQLEREENIRRFAELEQVAGRNLKQRKNGSVDLRSVREKTPAQKAAWAALQERNAERRALKKKQEAEKIEQAANAATTATIKNLQKKAQEVEAIQQQQQQQQQAAPAKISDLFSN